MEDRRERLTSKAFALRKRMLEMCIAAGKGHVTSSLSCMEILVALYYGNILRHDPRNPQWEQRDRFILSKGQASPALYTILADLGYFDASLLERFARLNGRFAVHLQKDVPGVEITAGSLGQGFGLAAGLALGFQMNRTLQTVYCLIGDGECYEGSIWETAMFAAHNRLNNLVAIVDRNYLCVTDFTEKLVALEPLDEKWRSFGFHVVRVDGHSFDALLPVLHSLKSRPHPQPTAIIADTIKGCGVDCICYDPLWHGCAPRGEAAEECLLALEKGASHVQ
ncbi:MAG: transketolase [Phycisphaerae bacterium]|nr:transketolase [Phycisphaerae bacterium]